MYIIFFFLFFVSFFISIIFFFFFFFSSRRRHTRLVSDWSSDVCSSDLESVRLADRTGIMSRQYTLQRAPRSTSIHIDYAAELNEQQLAAVIAPPGPLLVIAGAGSGKTRTLTYRVAYLLENGIDPRNILLLTFTNKAARQMLDRVSNLLPVDANGLWGGTFHSVGNRILRRHGSALGYSSGFTIMDREDQKDLINTVVTSAGIDPKEIRFPK